MPHDHWSHAYVSVASACGLFAGVSDSRFGPDTAMTRGMLMTVLARLNG